jgi:adenine-specific DNA methylase
MYNLTLSLDPAVVREARIRAIGEGTSVSAKMREFLQHYAKLGSAVLKSTTEETAQPSPQQIAMAHFLELAKTSTYQSGDYKWNREALYDRKIAGR